MINSWYEQCRRDERMTEDEGVNTIKKSKRNAGNYAMYYKWKIY